MTHEQTARRVQAVGMLTAQLGAAKVLSSGPAAAKLILPPEGQRQSPQITFAMDMP